MSEANHLKRQLIRYRDLLANMSRRNREIYFRESKGSSVNLTKPPFAPGLLNEKTSKSIEPIRTLGETFDEIIKGSEFNLHDYFQIEHLVDAESANKLINKMEKIRLADDRHQREFGISGAWLLGPFLCWRTSAQSPKSDLLISPILKIPVDLKKNKRHQHMLLVEDDKIEISPSLRLCLKQKLGLDIPEGSTFNSAKEAIDFLSNALGTIQKTLKTFDRKPESLPRIPPRLKIVKDKNGEIVERQPVVLEQELSADDLAIYEAVTFTQFYVIDVLYLDQLNASRTVLINDYESILENPTDHPILNELFNGTPLSDEPPVDRSSLRELDAYRERDNHFVVSIDSTQHRAIDKATKSKAIVIQGPPGTGKSQTITNLIAEYLAKGKRVLFVSEKRPALDVVYNRLKSANIEAQSVLIHSSDLDKSDLYKSFLELADLAPSEANARERQNSAEALDRVKKDINSYADSLQEKHVPSHINVSELMLLASKHDKGLFEPLLKSAFENLDYDILCMLLADVREVQSVLSTIKEPANCPWINRLPTTVNSSTLIHDLKTLESEIINIRDKRDAIRQEAAQILKVPNFFDYEKQLSGLSATWAQFSAQIPGEESVWQSIGNDPRVGLSKITDDLKKLIAVLDLNVSGYASISPDADPELVEQLEEYYRIPRGFSDYFSGAFWAFRRARNQICKSWDGSHKQFKNFREYKRTVGEVQTLLASLGLKQEFGNADLPKIKRDIESICTSLYSLQKIYDSLSQLSPACFKASKSSRVDFLKTVEACIEADQLVRDYIRLGSEAVQSLKILSRYMTQAPAPDESLTSISQFISALLERVNDLDAIDRADILISTASERNKLPTLRKIIFETLAKKQCDWAEAIESSVLNGWADDVRSRHASIRTFERSQHHSRIGDFREQEDRHQRSSIEAVHNAFAERWRTSSDRTGIPLLKKEAAKQRRVLSPREIMEKGALKTMMQLKPCWLMSPLSISQMLPLEKALFDVIIFDEASQVRVEDAIPSIYRASTMIVVGDNKQMPPTSFFSGAASDDDEDEEPISDSILDLATAVYPSVLLEWHYRSREESLIAFSNRAFYLGRLIAAPNPASLASGGAIAFHDVPNAYFTSKQGNEVEADAVISHLITLIEQNDRLSYGVIAMGQSQSVALEEALERRIADDSKARKLIEHAMNFKDGDADAGLFIKNLENVQGDERDVIIMSVGYAPSAPGKKLIMNFGPLSKQGGGRRLNVAITRAKQKMVVFSSFDPSSLPTDEETYIRNPDLCVFGRYLKYAKAVSAGNSESAMAILDSFGMGGVITSRKSSRFALDVKRRLEELGYLVSAEIGSSGFYIDLAIHHPTQQSNFVLGIECDGAIFHSTPYARDRDKIREALLKSRGWRIERVWSQDWSADWRREIMRLDTAIKLLLKTSDQPLDQLKRASGE